MYMVPNMYITKYTYFVNSITKYKNKFWFYKKIYRNFVSILAHHKECLNIKICTNRSLQFVKSSQIDRFDSVPISTSDVKKKNSYQIKIENKILIKF